MQGIREVDQNDYLYDDKEDGKDASYLSVMVEKVIGYEKHADQHANKTNQFQHPAFAIDSSGSFGQAEETMGDKKTEQCKADPIDGSKALTLTCSNESTQQQNNSNNNNKKVKTMLSHDQRRGTQHDAAEERLEAKNEPESQMEYWNFQTSMRKGWPQKRKQMAVITESIIKIK